MSRRLGSTCVSGVLLLTLCCGGPELRNDAEVLVEIASQGADRLSVRVWNEEHDLVYDEWLDDASTTLRFFPREAPAHYRYARVEVEAWSASGCPTGRETRTYRLVAGRQQEVHIEVDVAEEANCRPLWVSTAGSGQSCSEAEPCQLAVALSDAETSQQRVILLDGSSPYTGAITLFSDLSGTSERPTVLRSLPGTGRARLMGNRDIDTVVNSCCDEDGGVSHLELDGLEVLEAGSLGVQLHGPASHHLAIRNSVFRRNGLSPEQHGRAQGAAIAVVVGANEVLLEHNLFEDNRSSDGTPVHAIRVQHAGAGGPEVLRVLASRFLEDGSDAIELNNVEGRAVFANNIFCTGAGAAMRQIDNSFVQELDIDANVFLGSSMAALVLRDQFPKNVTNNTFVIDGGTGVQALSAGGSPPHVADNLFVGDGTAVSGSVSATANAFWNLESVGSQPQEDVDPEALFDSAMCAYGGSRSSAGACPSWPDCPDP